MGHVGPVEAGGMGSFCSSWSMSFSGLGAWSGLAHCRIPQSLAPGPFSTGP